MHSSIEITYSPQAAFSLHLICRVTTKARSSVSLYNALKVFDEKASLEEERNEMQQPLTPNTPPSETTSNSTEKKGTATATKKRKLPTPKELISHYESQGLDSQEASMKVIEDLQKALFGVISSGRGKKDRLLGDTSRKIDAINSRVAVLDMKVDSKPGYAETFAIGVASGAAFTGIKAVMPHVLGGIAQIWNSVTNATKSSP